VGGTSNVAVVATTGAFITGVSSATGNITGGNLLTAGLISASGAITGAGITGTSLTVSTGNITGGNLILSGAIVDSAQLDIQTSAANANIVLTPNGIGNVNTGANLSVTGNITGGNVLGGANVNATLFTGTTVSVTGNITGGNILGGANVNATTHTGTTVSVSANITGGNLLTGGLISATGNITGGNVTATTGLTAGTLSLTGNTITSTDSIITIDPATSGINGAVIIQGNLSVTGNVTYINSNNVTTNDLTINVANNAATAAAANGGGIEVGPAGAQYASFTYNSTSNIWVVSNGATVSGILSATGNITGGNVLGGANVNATTHTGTSVSVTGNITGGNVLGGANVNATTHTGTTVSVTGNITGGNLSVGTGTITGGNIVNSNANGVGNIGSSTTYFNTVFAKATSALYADLAEKYLADQEYEIGTVLAVGGNAEVTACRIGDRAIGAVSENPAYKMNDGLENGTYVALKGRVPVKVIGTVRKGQRLVAHNNGCAVAGVAHADDVFAVALESSDDVGVKLVEALIL
jgi:hypothetical protein